MCSFICICSLKIKFDKEEELQEVIENCITIFNHRFMVELYNFKPRVIKCNKCQKYGHLARLCQSVEICGKCKSKNHETRDCEEEKENYICYHCDGNHQAGDKECVEYQRIEAAIRNRKQNV